MEQHTTHRLPEELIQAQVRQYNSQTKKTLWETVYISPDEAAFLLDISKETLRDRAMTYKATRIGNKFYYSTESLKEALQRGNAQEWKKQNDLASAYENLIKPKKS
jgi:hypothetical protein